MSKKSPVTITEALRQAILDSGEPYLRLQNETGVERGSIARFVRGDRSLRLDIADKLALHFGLELRANAEDEGAHPGGTEGSERLPRTRRGKG